MAQRWYRHEDTPLFLGTLQGKLANLDQNRLKLMRRAVASGVAHSLTDLQRETVLLYYFEGFTVEEIAKMRGVNKANVSRLMARARRRLERTLQCLMVEEFRPELEE